jgi:hypothetical protein
MVHDVCVTHPCTDANVSTPALLAARDLVLSETHIEVFGKLVRHNVLM